MYKSNDVLVERLKALRNGADRGFVRYSDHYEADLERYQRAQSETALSNHYGGALTLIFFFIDAYNDGVPHRVRHF